MRHTVNPTYLMGYCDWTPVQYCSQNRCYVFFQDSIQPTRWISRIFVLYDALDWGLLTWMVFQGFPILSGHEVLLFEHLLFSFTNFLYFFMIFYDFAIIIIVIITCINMLIIITIRIFSFLMLLLLSVVVFIILIYTLAHIKYI